MRDNNEIIDSVRDLGEMAKNVIDNDEKLDYATDLIRQASCSIGSIVDGGFYDETSEKSREEFRFAANGLVSGIEKIFKNG